MPDIVRAGPGDRGCCPTEVVTLQYRLEDGRLSETVQVGASTTLSLAYHGSDCAALFRAREERATRRHRHPERLSFEG